MIGLQMTIPQLTNQLSYTRIAIGSLGEQLVARALESQGYQVATSHHYQQGDLTVTTLDGEILYIEVKTARKGKDGWYHFTLYKHWQGRTCADHKNADFIVLLCVMKTGNVIPFVVPIGSRIKTLKHVAVSHYPNEYRGWLSQFRQSITHLTLSDCLNE